MPAGTSCGSPATEPGSGTDAAAAIAVDSLGSVLVTGYSDGGPAAAEDYATIKYSE